MTTKATAVREAILKSVNMAGLNFAQYGFLVFAGILPLTLPDGTRYVVLPDIHSPAHNRRLIWAIKQFLAWYKPDFLIFIGDLADIFALSRHPKQLRAVANAQMELDVTRRLVDELMEVSGAAWSFIIPGNHEDRVYRFLQDMAPQLGSVVDPHSLEPLSFHSLMGYTDKDPVTFLYGTEMRGGYEGGLLINNDLGFHHGIIVAPKPGISPMRDMDRWSRSIAHGHTHRLGLGSRDVTPTDEMIAGVIRGYELGMLVDMDHAYMAYAKQMWPNWHPGFAVGTVHNGVNHLQPVPIAPVTDENGHSKLTFVWDGKVFTESDR